LRSARQRIARLRDQRQEEDADRSESESRWVQQSEELTTRRADLEDRQQAFHEERRRWEIERDEAQQQIGRRAEELDARQAELEAQIEASQQQEQGGDAERSEPESRWVQQSEELTTRLADLEDCQQAFHEERRRWETERDEAQQQLSARAEALHTRQAELEARQSELDAEQQQREFQRDAVQPQGEESAELQFQEGSTTAPVTSGDVLRRLGMAPRFSEEEEDEPAAEFPLAHGNAPEASRHLLQPDTAPNQAEDDGESVDDYMARLLARVGGGKADGGRSPVSSPAPRRAPDPPRDSSPNPEAAGLSPTLPAAADVPDQSEPSDMSPRAAAPEKTIDLSAMRELANFSAHRAIDRHSRGNLKRAGMNKLLVTLFSLAAGGAMLWIWRYKSPTDLAFYAAMVSFLASVCWGMQYALLTGRLIISRSGRLYLPPKPDDDAPADTVPEAGDDLPAE